MAIVEYSITYTWTNLGKTDSRDITLQRSAAAVSGCMDTIGQITRATITHYHTGGTSGMTATTAAQLKNGSTVISGSDNVSGNFGTNTKVRFVNTLSTIPSTVSAFDAWTNIRVWMVSQKPTGYKFYSYVGDGKSTSLTVYFYRQVDLCPDAANPTIGTVTQSDGAMASRTGNPILTEVGSYIAGYSKPTLSVPITLDWVKYDYITGQARITVTNPDGDAIISQETTIDTSNRTASVTLDPLAAGTYTYKITVTDVGSNTATKSGSFTVRAYVKPTAEITVKRYARSLNASGSTVYVQDDSGEYVRFWVNATTENINSKNTLTAILTYGTENGQTGSASIASLSGTSLSVNASEQNYLNNKTFSAGSRFWFTLTVTDDLSSAADTSWIDVAGAVFDVEPNGVAIGKRSEATPLNPMFEVAWPMVRYGLYDTNEHIIGTIVRNGKEVPVYEQTIINDAGFASPSEAVFGAFSAGGDFDLVLDFDFSIQAVNGNASTVPTNANGWITGTHYYAASNWRYVQVMIATGEAKVVSNNSGSWIKCITCTMRYTRKSDLT